MSIQAQKKEILAALLACHIHKVVGEFSGGGDSGDVNDVTAFDMDQGTEKDPVEVDLEKSTLTIDVIEEESVMNPKTGKYIKLKKKVQKPLKEALHNFIYEAACQGQGDWVNNEGGQGNVEINVKEGAVVVNIGYNVTTTDDHTIEL